MTSIGFNTTSVSVIDSNSGFSSTLPHPKATKPKTTAKKATTKKTTTKKTAVKKRVTEESTPIVKEEANVEASNVIEATSEQVMQQIVYQKSFQVLDREVEENETFGVGDAMPIYLF